MSRALGRTLVSVHQHPGYPQTVLALLQEGSHVVEGEEGMAVRSPPGPEPLPPGELAPAIKLDEALVAVPALAVRGSYLLI